MPSLSYTGGYPPQYRSRDNEFIRGENRTLKVIRIRFYYSKIFIMKKFFIGLLIIQSVLQAQYLFLI